MGLRSGNCVADTRWDVVAESFSTDHPQTMLQNTRPAVFVYATELHVKDRRVFGDSKLVINQCRGEFKVLEPKLMEYHAVVQHLIDSFGLIDFRHIPRLQNELTDSMARAGRLFCSPTQNDIHYVMASLDEFPSFRKHSQSEA
ncbi:hypothetical protein EJ110_NYTH47838 [Nymphaea thermarum]|nr:hypothetical protein EJ110_NYTH47838 [Nymphaea thermarum]